jgi:20S proteasome subunit alpha 7|tara:strand:+ start:62 stop:649 length:588 start_codon:yes stop_codon:yes gene_type:complete
MMISGTDKRAYNVTRNIGAVCNGMVPDGRCQINRAREEAAQYETNFGIKIPGCVLADRMALQFQMHTIYSSYRPYGTSLVMATHDMIKGPQLWMIEPSGQCFEYYGCASGRGKQLARNEIDKGKFREQTVEESLPKIAKMLLKSQEEMKDKKQELELMYMSTGTNWVSKIVDRVTSDRMCATAMDQIKNEDEEMN